jgi:hypothetical protein
MVFQDLINKIKPKIDVGNWGTTTSRQYPTQQETAEMLLTDKQLVHDTHPSGLQPEYPNNPGHYYNNNNPNSTNSNRSTNTSGQHQQSGQNYQNNGQYRQSLHHNHQQQQQQNYNNSSANNLSRTGSKNNYNNNSTNSRQSHNKPSYQSYHNSYSQYHENSSGAAAYTVPSIVKEKDFNHIDDLINNSNNDNSSISGGGGGQGVHGGRGDQSGVNGGRADGQQHRGDLDYGGEENWAYISQNVDYDEKIQFLDDEEEAESAEGEEVKTGELNKAEQGFVESQGANEDESQWDAKRKYNDEEMKKSIERARLRRAEEERRLSEQRQAVCAEKLRQLNLKKQPVEASHGGQMNTSNEFNNTNGSFNDSANNNYVNNNSSANLENRQYTDEAGYFEEDNQRVGYGQRNSAANVKPPHSQQSHEIQNQTRPVTTTATATNSR